MNACRLLLLVSQMNDRCQMAMVIDHMLFRTVNGTATKFYDCKVAWINRGFASSLHRHKVAAVSQDICQFNPLCLTFTLQNMK